MPAATKPPANETASDRQGNQQTGTPEPNETASDKTPLKKTDEFGATVETLVVVQPLEEEQDDTCYIEYREPYTDDQGVQHLRVHRVPRENWDKYARKHGF